MAESVGPSGACWSRVSSDIVFASGWFQVRRDRALRPDGSTAEGAAPAMTEVLELRQYTLRPGRRDALIDLFDREFVETQEAAGMAVLGQFRDLRDPDRFVWLRGFADMPSRAAALNRFYGGPVWAAHRDAANATMIDSDDVLLLRPVGDGFPLPAARGTELPQSRFLAGLHFADAPFDKVPEPEVPPLAAFTTAQEENTFPALPIREGEHAYVWFARFDDQATLGAYVSGADPAATLLELAPTARSLLRWMLALTGGGTPPRDCPRAVRTYGF